MRQFYDQTKNSARAFRAYTVVCLVMLQAIAFLFAPLGKNHVQSDIHGVSLAFAGVICGTDGDHGDPTHSSHEHHCMICASGGRSDPSGALALLTVVAVLIEPEAEETTTAFIAREAPSLQAARFGIPISRGPPTSFS
jgi:hypothetical protein